jgi:hypothetical protein
MIRLFIIQNLKKHLWKTNNLYLVLFTAVLITGCGEKTEKKEYVARVNDSFLTSDDLEYLSGTSYKNNFYRSEVIRNWIDEELLFQEAVNEGILETEEFNRIINNSRRELAGALLLKYVSDQYEFSYSNDDLEKFYNEFKDEFRLKDDTFILNIAEFTSEEKAIEFRISVLQNDWQEVIESGKFNEIPGKNNLVLKESEIYPLSLRNIIQELYPQEVSIVINSDTLSYRIFQVIEKYTEGTIPPFSIIKEVVEKRFVSLEKRKFINEYIKKLYSENDIEVKNQDNK